MSTFTEVPLFDLPPVEQHHACTQPRCSCGRWTPVPPAVETHAPTSRRSDPVTSREAAESVAPHAVTDRWLVLAILVELGDEGGTDFEVADIAGREQTSLGVRRKGLERDGLVECRSGPDGEQMKRPNVRDKRCLVWFATPEGVEALRNHERSAA